MRKNFNHFWPSVLTVVLILLTACTDNKYDLGNLDKTIALGNDKGIALPGNNSTREIILNDLLAIDTTGCIKIDTTTGQYIFRQKSNDVEATTARINPITLISKQEDIHPFTVDIPINVKDLLEKGGLLARDAHKALLEETTLKVCSFNFSQEGHRDVVWLDEASTTSHLTLEIIFSDDIKRVLKSFSGLSVDFPDFLKLTNFKKDGTNITVDNGNIVKLGRIYPEKNLIVEADVETLYFNTEEEIAFNEEEYLVCCQDSLTMNGFINIIVSYENDMANINVDEALNIIEQQLNGQRDDFNLNISSDFCMSDFNITSATGRFQPNIKLDNIGSIEINENIPDFLNDPEVTINIDNPILTLNLTSDFLVDGLIDGVLTSTMKDGEIVTLHVDDIRMKKNTISNIMICARNPNNSIYNETTGWQVIEKGQAFRNIIKKIPERIDFGCVINADTNDVGTIDIDKDYHIKPAYNFDAPLALNTGSKIVYHDELDGWYGELKNLDLSKNATIEITANATNGSPLALHLTVTPFDIDHTSLADDINVVVETSESDNTIPASRKPGTIHITISQNNKGAFKKLDGIAFKAIAVSMENGNVLNSGTGTENTTQTLRLEDVSIFLTGKLEIDLNDHDEEN